MYLHKYIPYLVSEECGEEREEEGGVAKEVHCCLT